MGDKINALRLPFQGRGKESDGGGFWGWSARAVMARPVISVIAVVGLLVGLTIPVLGINTGLPGVSTFPSDTEVGFANERSHNKPVSVSQ